MPRRGHWIRRIVVDPTAGNSDLSNASLTPAIGPWPRPVWHDRADALMSSPFANEATGRDGRRGMNSQVSPCSATTHASRIHGDLHTRQASVRAWLPHTRLRPHRGERHESAGSQPRHASAPTTRRGAQSGPGRAAMATDRSGFSARARPRHESRPRETGPGRFTAAAESLTGSRRFLLVRRAPQPRNPSPARPCR